MTHAENAFVGRLAAAVHLGRYLHQAWRATFRIAYPISAALWAAVVSS
jgi:hypothetical protein